MSNFAVGSFVGSHNETMISEEGKIAESKKNISNKYITYSMDNEELVKNWEGNAGAIFSRYSNIMNKMIQGAIETTQNYGNDVNIFYNQSLKTDTLADGNVKGE